MKKSIILPVSLLVIFSACKKGSSSPSGGNSIKATINGTVETFNTSATAVVNNSYGAYSLAIIGLSSSSTNTDQIGLAIEGSAAVKAGTTYTGGVTSDDGGQITYIKQGSSIVYQSTTNACTITITSISATNVQGTFSGPLTLENGTGASTVTVTNGSFNLTIQ